MIKSYAVVMYVSNLGHTAPKFYSSLSLAYRAFIDALSKYEGNRDEVRCLCIGEFDHDSGVCSLYDTAIDVSLDVCDHEAEFDQVLFDMVQTYFTNNEKSMYQLALKIPASGKD